MTSPAQLSQRIAEADQVIVTNRYRAIGQTISREEADSLVKSIASAKKKTSGTDLDWASERVWDVDFYAGTNRMASIPVYYGIFQLEGVEYADSTGSLQKIWMKLDENGRK